MPKQLLSILVVLLFMSCNNTKQSHIAHKATTSLMDKSFIGTYTRDEGWVHGKADGIYSFLLDDSGNLIDVKKEVSTINPSFVAKSKNGKFLLAVSELGRPDEKHGLIKSYKIETDRLIEVSVQSTIGTGPCYVSSSLDGNLVFVANYSGGSISSYRLDENGILTLGDSKQFTGKGTHPRQESAHAHAIYPHPADHLVFVPDLGNDKIWIMKYDKEGVFTTGSQPYLEVKSESGPRHISISKDGKHIYVLNELSNTISHFMKDKEDYILADYYPTLPDGFIGENTSADIHIHPSGKFLYSSNRGHNSIAQYSIQEDGSLSGHTIFSSEGAVPRNFNITPDGRYLLVANQDSDDVVSFKIEEKDGRLNKIAVADSIYTPVCIEW